MYGFIVARRDNIYDAQRGEAKGYIYIRLIVRESIRVRVRLSFTRMIFLRLKRARGALNI